jgi:short-subunit dehydrogenase
MRVLGRVVVVTGASSGIGAACALAVARRQARAVVLLARTAAALERVAREVRALGAEALPLAVDLTDPGAVEDVKARVENAFGVPDVLVNNAGAGRWLFVEETSPAEAVQLMAAPYFAAFFATRAFLPGMISRGSGHVVNVTSVAAYAPWPGATGYAAARWAMRGFTEALRADLRGTGVGVTLFAPGKVSSPYFEHNSGTEERLPRVARLYRTLTPEEAAEALVRGVERGSRAVVTPALLRLTVWLHRLWPGAVSSLVVRTGAKRAAQRAPGAEPRERRTP